MTMREISTTDLLRELNGVTSDADARAMVSRASRMAGAPDGPLHLEELLLMCEALAAEGGPVQRLAEEIAMRAVHPGGPA